MEIWVRTERGTRLYAVLVVGMGIIGGSLVPLAPGVAGGRDAHLPPPGPSLNTARQEAGFELREPSYVPEGMYLFLVNWSTPEEGETASSVGLYYRADDGRSFHIWQTNNSELVGSTKDVMAVGSDVQVEGRPWKTIWLADQGLHVLNHYYERDGVTLSMDGNIDPGELHRVAASIRSN